MKMNRNEFFKLISNNESLVLGESDGTEILADVNVLFAHIDSDFVGWGADEKGHAIPQVSVAVYEMVKDATFSQMFGSFSPDVRKLCLTQAQIKGFVKKYRNWLRTNGYATCFLFESNSHFFVAGVHVDSDGELRVDVDRFERSYVWITECRLQVVVPQLA